MSRKRKQKVFECAFIGIFFIITFWFLYTQTDYYENSANLQGLVYNRGDSISTSQFFHRGTNFASHSYRNNNNNNNKNILKSFNASLYYHKRSKFTCVDKERTIHTTSFDCVSINSSDARYPKNSQFCQRFNISYDRKHECTDKTIHPPDKLFPYFDDPTIIWEWISPKYDKNGIDIESKQNQKPKEKEKEKPDYSLIYTAFDTKNIMDIAMLLAVMFARGKYELIIVFDAFDDNSIEFLFRLLKTWIYHYIYNPNKLDCTHLSITQGTSGNTQCHHFSKFDVRQLFSKNITVFNKAVKYYLHCFYTFENLHPYFEYQNGLAYKYCSRDKNFNWIKNCGEILRIVLVAADGIWETSSNNLGMCLSDSSSKYYLHFQDDMLMTQYGFNIHWSLPIIIWPDWIWSISGRQSHGISQCGSKFFAKMKLLPNSSKVIHSSKYYRDRSETKKFLQQSGIYKRNYNSIGAGDGKKDELKQYQSANAYDYRIGRLDKSIDAPLPWSENTSIVHVRDMSNRGPLVFSSKDVWKLKLFDEYNFHILLDDGEIHTRAVSGLLKFSGWLPLQFAAKLKWGASRRNRRSKTRYEDKIRLYFDQWRGRRENKRASFHGKYIVNMMEMREISQRDLKTVDQIYDLCYSPS